MQRTIRLLSAALTVSISSVVAYQGRLDAALIIATAGAMVVFVLDDANFNFPQD